MSQPSEWAMGNARKLPVAVGLEQCWCDLTKSEIGCPTCRVEDAIARALDAARAEEREACAKVAGNAFRGYLRPLGSPGTYEYDIDVAAAIRARGDA